MNIIRTGDFERSFGRLPKNIQQSYAVQESRFRENRGDSRLHIKKVHGFREVYSFRITRNYRGLFYFQNPDTAIFFDIDHRKDIYR